MSLHHPLGFKDGTPTGRCWDPKRGETLFPNAGPSGGDVDHCNPDGCRGPLDVTDAECNGTAFCELKKTQQKMVFFFCTKRFFSKRFLSDLADLFHFCCNKKV